MNYSNDITSHIEYLSNLYVLDYDKFSKAIYLQLENVDLTKINYPKKYINKIVEDLDLEQYKKKRIAISLKEMFEDMKMRGFKGWQAELIYLEYIEEHCINELPVSAEEITELNHKAVDYVEAKYQPNERTYANVIDAITRSKLLAKCQVPYEALKKKAYEEQEEITKGLEKLSRMANERGR